MRVTIPKSAFNSSVLPLLTGPHPPLPVVLRRVRDRGKACLPSSGIVYRLSHAAACAMSWWCVLWQRQTVTAPSPCSAR